MADNVTSSAGTADGAVFATDDATGVHHPYIKLEFGADNTQTKVSSSDPLPVVQTGTHNIGTVTAVTAITNALPAGDNNVGNFDLASAIPAGTNNIGDVDIASIAAGDNNIGNVDVASIAAGSNSIGNVGLVGRTSGGLTIFKSIDLDETEEEVKATPGQVFSITAFNTTAAPLYLKFYNLTAANTTVGTSTPVATFVIPGNADSDGAGFVWNNAIGLAFGTAITVACTTAVADADTGAPGANACIVVIGYA